MQTANKPENNNKSNEAHPSLGKARLQPEHINAIAEWIKDAKADEATSTGKDKVYFQGQSAAFKLVWELIHGEILESDTGIPF